MLSYEQFLTDKGEKRYRIAQIDQAIFRDLVADWSEVSTLPAALREAIAEAVPFSPFRVVREATTPDGQTTKVLFAASDGSKIESVLMRHHKGGRTTVCVSCQVGCAMGCVFCATGGLGITRNLTTDEIVAQALHFARLLKTQGGDRHITNIVFMGMGEPFINIDAVFEAVSIFNDPKRLGIGARHITISTSGVIPGIERFTEELPQINLAISIHAPTDELRSELMPINRRYPLADLMRSLDRYTEKTGRRLFYEYIMLKNRNDRAEHAEALGKLLSGRLAHVNLLPYNPANKADILKATDKNDLFRFQAILERHGVPSTVRVSLGQEVDGACGQLAAKDQFEKGSV